MSIRVFVWCMCAIKDLYTCSQTVCGVSHSYALDRLYTLCASLDGTEPSCEMMLIDLIMARDCRCAVFPVPPQQESCHASSPMASLMREQTNVFLSSTLQVSFQLKARNRLQCQGSKCSNRRSDYTHRKVVLKSWMTMNRNNSWVVHVQCMQGRRTEMLTREES